jgi:hypothetical protein
MSSLGGLSGTGSRRGLTGTKRPATSHFNWMRESLKKSRSLCYVRI